MDLRQLKYFHAVAKYESLTAASEALNVTQPAVGQQIRKLEESLGLKLLFRHSRGMRLSPVGKILFRRAEEILHMVERTERELARHRNSSAGTIRIGVTPSLSAVLVPHLMEVCFDRYPDITLLFNQGFPADLEQMWEAGECDLAFFNKDIETDEAESIPLYNEKLCLIGPSSASESLNNPIAVKEIADLPIVLDVRSLWAKEQLEKQFRGLKTKWSDLIECSSIDIRREYLVQGQRFCVAPIAQFEAEIAKGKARSINIDLPEFDRTIHLVSPRVEMLTEAESVVRRTILEIVDNLVKLGKIGWGYPVWHS